MDNETQEQIGDRRIRLALTFLLSITLTLTAAWVGSALRATSGDKYVASGKARPQAGSTRLCPSQTAPQKDTTGGTGLLERDVRQAAIITFRTIAKAALEKVEPVAKTVDNHTP